MSRAASLACILALACGVSVAAGAAGATPPETLHYRWRLDGFVGVLAGLFFPNEGEGELTLEAVGEDRLRSELLVTAKGGTRQDFFRYGAEWERATLRTRRAWSSQLWRGERKQKNADIEDEGVVDIATAIYYLRARPPERSVRLEIWSDGKLYPVIVLPQGRELRSIDGKEVAVRHFAIRPLELPERRVWRGEFDLWLAEDEGATPVEMVVARSAARVRLSLVAEPETTESDAGEAP